MIGTLFVSKRYGNYADTFLMLGLAKLAEYALGQTGHKREITLIDEGIRYRLQFKEAVNLEKVFTLQFTNLFPPVVGAKTDKSGIPEEVEPFNTVELSDARRLYREYLYQGGKKLELGDNAPEPPDPRTQNGVILTSMRHDRNHNGFWQEAWNLREHFAKLVAAILQAFAHDNPLPTGTEAQKVADLLGKKCKLPAPTSAVKLFIPTAVQGVNRLKADNNKTDSQKDDWLTLWLIAAGLFEFGFSERVKVAESTYDWRVVALIPKEISLSEYRTVLDELRKYDPPGGGHGIARFDAELVLKFSRELLNRHPVKEQSQVQQRTHRCRGQSVKASVSGFSGTHFGSKGQVYGVKEVFSLGLPKWIQPETTQEAIGYQRVLREHLAIVQSLPSEEVELLAAYRDFITGNDLQLFFRFQVSYADYIVRQFADPKAKSLPKQFSEEGLDVMTRSFDKADQNYSISEITENDGFLRIARAINSATVYAGKITVKKAEGVYERIELDWQRTYGLAQRLGNHIVSKENFTAELTAFLTSYQNENLRLIEKLEKEGKSLKRVRVNKEDLDQFLKVLYDRRFSCSLVANLLLAYGYAKWKKPLKDENPDTLIVADEDPEELLAKEALQS
jgi:hypothetical protein